MKLNEKIIYTPEVITVTKGTPVSAKVVGISANETYYTLELEDGSTIRADKKDCSK